MNCCICGTVKNCGPYLNSVLKNIEKIGTLFNEYKAVLFYDNSNDNTLQILQEYAKYNSKFNLIINETHVSDCRTIRIAYGRNKCLEFVYNNCPDYEYFIVMDMDDVSIVNIKLDILQKYLYKDTWDCLSFNRHEYYDIWALSISPYNLSCWHYEPNIVEIMKNDITNKLKSIQEDELLECHSAFNGFAIYRKDKFVDCSYNGTIQLNLIPQHLIDESNTFVNNFFNSNKEPGDCEHRYFHLMATKKHNAKIRISPLYLF
jgi:hypothetical protein